MKEEITKLPDVEAKQMLKLPNSYFEKGIQKGESIKGRAIAEKMLKKGMDIQSIMEFTDLPKEVITEIEKELKKE